MQAHRHTCGVARRAAALAAYEVQCGSVDGVGAEVWHEGHSATTFRLGDVVASGGGAARRCGLEGGFGPPWFHSAVACGVQTDDAELHTVGGARQR